MPGFNNKASNETLEQFFKLLTDCANNRDVYECVREIQFVDVRDAIAFYLSFAAEITVRVAQRQMVSVEEVVSKVKLTVFEQLKDEDNYSDN